MSRPGPALAIGYTPGPYVFCRGGDGCDQCIDIICVSEASVLATIRLPWESSPAEVEQAEANARLFAAAPRLVDALEVLLDAAASGVDDSYRAAANTARDVIAEVRRTRAMEQAVEQSCRSEMTNQERRGSSCNEEDEK